MDGETYLMTKTYLTCPVITENLAFIDYKHQIESDVKDDYSFCLHACLKNSRKGSRQMRRMNCFSTAQRFPCLTNFCQVL